MLSECSFVTTSIPASVEYRRRTKMESIQKHHEKAITQTNKKFNNNKENCRTFPVLRQNKSKRTQMKTINTFDDDDDADNNDGCDSIIPTNIVISDLL